jgi:predicted flap endonuclease-1-like 5' DNA nuclease
MTLPFLPDVPKIDPEKGPNLFAGATSPLWLIFGGAAMAGATWWWWSARWREAVNLEAIMGAAPTSDVVFDPVVEAPVAAPAAVEALEAPALAAVAAVEAVVDATQEVLETVGAVAVEAIESVETALPPANDAAETIEAAPEEIEPVADDLTLLVGIGPKLAASLAGLGVTRFTQIAAWGAKELADFDTKLSLKGRAERDAWVAQAKRLANP